VNAWHVLPRDLEVYRDHTAEPLLADSIEAHLLRCAECRLALATTPHPAADADSTRRWAAVSAGVDSGTTSPMLRLGVSTGPLLLSLAVAVLLLVAIPLAVAVSAGAERVPAVLLAGAPLAPMLAVALAYRREADPAGELGLAVALAGIRLIVRRALVVSVLCGPIGVGAALAFGLPVGVALAWLLPGTALSALVLLAGTGRLDPAAIAAAAGGAWAIGVTLAARRGSPDRVVDVVAGAPVQLTSLLVAVLALALTVARRDRVAYRRSL
jgi:hypothetical protein